jgi:hypothetical protein
MVVNVCYGNASTVGSHRLSKVYARSDDAWEPIDEGTMWLWRCSREGEERKCVESVAPGEKFILWAFIFHFAKSKIVNSWRGAIFLLSILFWELANHKICQVKNSKLLEML